MTTESRLNVPSVACGPSALVFDGDDTLWITEPLYDRARDAAGRVVEAAGLDRGEWERLQRLVDVRNVELMGLSAERFPTSCVQAFEAVARTAGNALSEEARSLVWSAAASVFQAQAELVPNVHLVLRALRRDHRMVLLTQGDRDVQSRRIETSGLAQYFDEIRIVERKSPQEFVRLLRHLNVAPRDAWMVGNSIRSDILPAVAAGMFAVWVDAHVWEHERDVQVPAGGGYIAAQDLLEVLAIIRETETRGRTGECIG